MNLRNTLVLEPGSIVKVGPGWDPNVQRYVRDEWYGQRATVVLIDTDDACVQIDDDEGSHVWLAISRLELMN